MIAGANSPTVTFSALLLSEVERRDRVGKARHPGQDQAADHDIGHPVTRAERRGGPFHRNARADDDCNREHSDEHIPAATGLRVDRRLELDLLLCDRVGQPSRPSRRKSDLREALPARARDQQVGDHRRRRREQADPRAGTPDHDREADDREEHRDRPLEHDHSAVELYPPAGHRRESEQRRQVEDVGADQDPSSDLRLVIGQRRDRGGDLGRVCGQRREHAQQRLGQPEARTDALQARDEGITRRQADRGRDHERDDQQRVRQASS
jgi:hypothetical protein